jgi:hypothetical protein
MTPTAHRRVPVLTVDDQTVFRPAASLRKQDFCADALRRLWATHRRTGS